MTTGTKYDDGKPRYDLLSHPFLLGVSTVLTYGATKYDVHNWRGGIVYSRCFSALMRHLWAWWWGEDNDPETGLSHLWHAGCCLMFLTEFEQTSRHLDDRFKGAPHEALPKSDDYDARLVGPDRDG